MEFCDWPARLRASIWTHRWMDGQMDTRMDGQIDTLTDGQTDGWADFYVEIAF